MKKVLVIPDIHGRTFWKEPCNKIDEYEKIIFLGDYLDPYDFENISIEDAIANFEEIVDFANKNINKVVLLLGNHDLPYFDDYYFGLSKWHCRHSTLYHKDIHNFFKENRELFQIAYMYADILFTHAGCTKDWLNVLKKKGFNIEHLVSTLNSLLKSKDGLRCLYMVSRERGGWDLCGSCIWADVSEPYYDYYIQEIAKSPYVEPNEILEMKQVFGHTLQIPEKEREFGNCKMLDTRNAYKLDIDNFKIEKYG